ncbi:uncharacterized protein KD926_006510 [Aspergillus affinis]|uniref:uncharacterized protein n=1 Tax=Aspergillus affinis TaxID=1070780 RepID=UPI0022FE23EC|nr:uncharacterized protein KD926_006510 [Aspergillus affinis]KAI9041786.1 hypothetical protein KD926_006510 [Aspergillus affinis]
MPSLRSLESDAAHNSNMDKSVQTWNTVTQSLCITAMTIFFGLRAYTRLSLLNGFWKEDWTCLGAYFLGICYSIIALIMGHYGGGLHIDDVPIEHLIPFRKTVYVTMVMYGPTAYLTKVSLLWIMTRVFKPFRESVIAIYIFLGVMLAYYIPAVIVKIRICDPISKFWSPSTPGSCLDQNSIILADAVVSVVSDMIILLLPFPLTLRLQLPMKKKIRVMGILGAGGLACAFSVIRLILIVVTGQSKDGTIAFMRVNMCGNAEIAIGIVCASLPALSALITHVYNEYSTNGATHTSGQDVSKGRNPSNRDSRTEQVMPPLQLMEMDCDQNILMQHVQGQPRIETAVLSEGGHFHAEAGGILKTVDVSTSVSSRGGGSGFGAAIARRFGEEGAKVIIADINPEGGQKVAAQNPDQLLFKNLDVTSAEDWKAVVDGAVERFGRLDVLVNNAGTTYQNKPTAEVTEAEWERVFNVNVKGIFLGTNAFIPKLIEQGQGGSMINVSSTGATRPRPGLVWYNASKGAVSNATKGLAAEYGPHNIRVNTVSPLLSGTGLFSMFTGMPDTPENREKFIGNVPLGRLTDPDDVANMCLYLASDEGSFVNGTEMIVDGGKCI